MPVVYLSNKNTDGTSLGQAAADKVGFYGATPIVQNIALTTASAAATATDIVPVVNSIITFLKLVGLTA
jgi:hypothetical protein